MENGIKINEIKINTAKNKYICILKLKKNKNKIHNSNNTWQNNNTK